MNYQQICKISRKKTKPKWKYIFKKLGLYFLKHPVYDNVMHHRS